MEKLNTNVNIRISKADKKSLQDEAKKLNVTLSKLILDRLPIPQTK